MGLIDRDAAINALDGEITVFNFPKSKVKQLEYVRSLVSYLLAHGDKRNLYRDYGGKGIWRKISPKGTVLSISETKEANDDTD